MFEAMTEWVTNALYYSHYAQVQPAREGANHPAIAPYGPHRAGDGGLVIFGLQNAREWTRFCAEVMGDPALAEDPRFSDIPLRVAHRAELTALIEGRFASLSLAQTVALLDAAGVANAPINAMSDVWDHPQLAARERWRTVMTPSGPIQALLPPTNLSGVAPVMGEVPAVGEHSAAILAELGYDAAAIARLTAAEV
jgi:crotonobetainyl-CoA:carnitine CoA-transferase CaiB-like acyl-CoA transferase